MKKPLVQNQSTKGDPVIERMPAACADELKAVEFMEELRWGKHPACPMCGDMNVYKMQSQGGAREKNFRWRCRGCKQMYSVRKGTVMEDSAIPFRHWCFAFWRASTSKKGVSALEIHRQTGLSYKSALFLLHRIRYAMDATPSGQMGGPGKVVEVDETYWGTKRGTVKPTSPEERKRYRGTRVMKDKHAIVSMVERDGRVRSFHVANVTKDNLKEALAHIDRRSHLMTDESRPYTKLGRDFAQHSTVNHGRKEYARGEVTTNTIEGFFGILKRGLVGVYHNVSEEHLHRYLSEFDFRYSNRHLTDGERTQLAVRGADGKRLTYQETVRGLA